MSRRTTAAPSRSRCYSPSRPLVALGGRFHDVGEQITGERLEEAEDIVAGFAFFWRRDPWLHKTDARVHGDRGSLCHDRLTDEWQRGRLGRAALGRWGRVEDFGAVGGMRTDFLGSGVGQLIQYVKSMGTRAVDAKAVRKIIEFR